MSRFVYLFFLKQLICLCLFLSVFFSSLIVFSFLGGVYLSLSYSFQDMYNLNSIFFFSLLLSYFTIFVVVRSVLHFSNSSVMQCIRENIYRQYCWLSFSCICYFSIFDGQRKREQLKKIHEHFMFREYF